jgi:group I intron endonuclease
MICYQITNLINNKRYIGMISKNLAIRWRDHCDNASRKKLKNIALYAAINKYGIENFIVEEIASCIGNIDELKKLESYLIHQENTQSPNGYNLTSGGDGVVNPSDEVRKKMGDAKRGKSPWNKGKPSNRKGIPHSPEHKANISKSLKGIKFSEERKKNISIAKKGTKIPCSDSRREAIRLSWVARKLAKQTIETISNSTKLNQGS